MRAYIKAEKCTLDTSEFSTFNSLFYAQAILSEKDALDNKSYSLTEYFSKRLFGAYPFVTTPITTNALAEGSGYWADIFIGIPLVETNSSVFPGLVKLIHDIQ